MSLTPTNDHSRDNTEPREGQFHDRLNRLPNFEKIINQSDSIAYISKPNRDVVFITSNISKLGFQPEEFYLKQINFNTLIHIEDLEGVQAEINEASIQNNVNVYLEYRMISKTNDVIWVKEMFEMVNDPSGEIMYHGLITDITNQKLSEEKIFLQNKIIQLRNDTLYKVNEKLKNSHHDISMAYQKLVDSDEKLKVISEQSQLAVLILQDGLIKYFNQAFILLSEYSEEEIWWWKEFEFIKAIHHDDEKTIVASIDRILRSDKLEEEHFEFRGVTKKGVIKWVSHWAKTVIYHGKKGILITLLDIDERKKWQDALTESENRLRAKLDFILSPEKPIGDFKIIDIFDISQLQKIQDAFAVSHNVASIITNQDGIPITKPSNFSQVCTLIRSTQSGRALCQSSDKIIGQKARETLMPFSSKCLSCGFLDAGAPIIVGGKHIANWMISQGISKDINKGRLIHFASEIGIDEQDMEESLKNANFIETEQFNKIVDFLWIMAKEISALGYNNLILARDIQDRKKIEEELIRAKNKAEESDKLKSAFLANMSHEIRTPMNGILGFANLLNERETEPEERREYTEIINQNSNLLLKIIDDILDIAKIEAGQLKIIEKPCYLDQILYDEYVLFKNQVDKREHKSLTMRLKLPEFKIDNQIFTDHSRLSQILSNLLSNALKFTEKGIVEFGYILESPAQLKFYVKDTGIGLSADKFEMIFDRFRQADETQARRYGGTGLGLTISNNLVRLMGGTMWVESELGKGSVFYFTLPYKPYLERVIYKPKVTTDPKVSDFNWNDKSILIAEDELRNYQYLYEVLKDTNATIIHAKNGKEAIDICKENGNIDLVLMDIKMPEINGYIATQEIKKLRQDLPIIAQTAYAMQEEITQCKEAGCDEYVSKPIDSHKLLNLINNFINRT
jgi:PAS domain S-box-containing protein